MMSLAEQMMEQKQMDRLACESLKNISLGAEVRAIYAKHFDSAVDAETVKKDKKEPA